jgi:hypothetical protein
MQYDMPQKGVKHAKIQGTSSPLLQFSGSSTSEYDAVLISTACRGTSCLKVAPALSMTFSAENTVRKLLLPAATSCGVIA